MGTWMKYPKFEKMEVAVPATLEIKASGVTIGEMYRYGDNPNLYVVHQITQKFDLGTFVAMINEYWQAKERVVSSIIANFEDKDIMIYLEEKVTPRG